MHVPVGHLYAFFGEMSIQIFCPSFDWVIFFILSFMCCLYSLDINPLSVMSLANNFSHSEVRCVELQVSWVNFRGHTCKPEVRSWVDAGLRSHEFH